MFQASISIVICSYNRSAWLKTCLESLIDQLQDNNNIEVIVVDNNSTDNTHHMVSSLSCEYQYIHYCMESRQGLSYARNRGIASANSDWVNFLDDDACVLEGYVEKLRQYVLDDDYDCIGGVYLAWYPDGKKSWFRDDYASNQGLMEKKGVLPADKYASGGIILLRKSCVLAVGSFSETVGMKGKMLGYGEETHLQNKMRKRDFRLGFDPSWRICHRVSVEKQDLKWQLKSAWAMGRDAWVTFNNAPSLISLFRLCWRLLARPVRSLIKEVRFSDHQKSVQTVFLSIVAPFTMTLSEIIEGFRFYFKSHDS